MQTQQKIKILKISSNFFNCLPKSEDHTKIPNDCQLFKRADDDNMLYFNSISKGLMNLKLFKPYYLNNQTRLVFKHDVQNPELALSMSLMQVIREYHDQNANEMTLYFRAETDEKKSSVGDQSDSSISISNEEPTHSTEYFEIAFKRI